MYKTKIDALIIFFCAMLIFTVGLWQQEIIGFESRFYLFAIEMLRDGVSWFPTTYREPYPDYPGTATFFIYLMARLLGGLNKFTAVLPTAIAAATTVTTTYLIGALHMRRWGWYAVGFLLFTLAFVSEARTISLDMWVVACTTLAFYLAYSAQLTQKNPSWYWMMLLFIGSFAVRGPLGIVIPTGVLVIFYLLEKDFKHCLLIGLLGALGIVVGTIILLMLAYHVGNIAFLQDVLRMEILGRMQAYQTPPYYFYFLESWGAYAVTYPLAIAVLIGAMLAPKTPYGRFLQVLLGWVLVILIGLSIPADKKVRYILAIAPPLALLCSYLWVVVPSTRYFMGLQRIFMGICAVFPLLGLIALSVLHTHHVALSYTALTISLLILQSAMVIARQKDIIFALAVVTFLWMNLSVIEVINQNLNQTHRFVEHIEALRQQAHAKLVFYAEEKDGLVIKYLVNMPVAARPEFMMNTTFTSHIFFVTKAENFAALPLSVRSSLHIIAKGNIGHDPVIVFNKNVPHPVAAF